MNSYTDDKSTHKYLSMIIHTIKFHNILYESWRSRKVSGIIRFKFEGLRIREADKSYFNSRR